LIKCPSNDFPNYVNPIALAKLECCFVAVVFTGAIMGKKNKFQQKKIITAHKAPSPKTKPEKSSSIFPWIFLVAAITALCFLPMLQNDFTNWDDKSYVVDNSILRGPDWHAIFTQPLAGNYHPLTMITLAFNYQLSGLNAFSYLLVNLLLHVIDTGLVFYFIWLISGKKIWVAAFTALIFGIHPMHVESVAWVTERKDVLYTLFFILSVIQYWQYLKSNKLMNFVLCFLFFALSLLSKPAAIILPLVLFLLDYWKSRSLGKKLFLEKIPFFLAAISFSVITLKIQSPVAIGTFNDFPLWLRPFFACYTVMIYFLRFFIPYPLSAFHPFPSAESPGMLILTAPIFIIALLVLLWFFRKNKIMVFGLLFFLVNLALVSQIMPIGFTIVSERYTYTPYIGIAFMLGMWLNNYKAAFTKQLSWAIFSIAALVFGFMTFQRTKIWKDSGALWTDVIKHYPDASMPRTNRASYYSVLAVTPGHEKEMDSLYKQAIEDCTISIQNQPDNPDAYEKRGMIFLQQNRNKEASSDGDSVLIQAPFYKSGYEISSLAKIRLNEYEKGLEIINKCLSIFPNFDRVLKNRGDLLVTFYKKYSEALPDYNRAIELNPVGNYYVSRSLCYYNLGNIEKAKEDAQIALQKGASLPDNFRKALNL
jgi:tetratricopeptide (TPR) repeat protein